MPEIVTGWTITRGRNSEQDKTEPGRATITFKDFTGNLDPTNVSGPYYGLLNPNKQASIALQNPNTLEWSTLFYGYVVEWLYEMDITETFCNVTLELVDLFGLMAKMELTPGHHGDTVPSDSEGDIYYEGEPTTFKHVDQRIVKILDDAGIPGTGTPDTGLRNIFSGNVTGQEEVYARRDSMMNALTDAADSEFPGVANIYISKDGIVTFHGRYARFNPTNPGYGINSWEVGDIAAASDTSVVPISPLEFRRSSTDIINAAIALPKGVDEADVPGALVTDATSITDFGWSPVSFENLLTYAGHDDSGAATTAVVETKLFASYYVDNYKDPKTRVSTLKFLPLGPDTANGPALWDLMCGVEIGDLMHLTTTHPGGGGFDEDFFVEGIRYDAKPMNDRHPEITLEVDVSPRSLFDTSPFGTLDNSFPQAALAGTGTLVATGSTA